MILIRNTQRKIPLDIKAIERDIEAILVFLGYQEFDIGIWFTTNKTIAQYNKQYRNKDTPTDILSFPHHPLLQAGERIVVKDEDDKNLGDIIISPAYAAQQATREQKPFEDHLRMILVHGVCHLLGYDHIEDSDYALMQKEENRILNHIKQLI